MNGYLCLTRDGDVLPFGEAPLHGTAAGLLDGDATAITVAPDVEGYWVASRRGHVVGLGVPDIVGPGRVPTSRDVVDVVATAAGHGLWAVDAAGGVFCFGVAEFHGSIPGLELGAPVEAVALTPTPDDRGYWILDHVGGVFCFGNADYFGSVPELGGGTAPAVALLPEPDGEGYTVVNQDGSTVAFGRVTQRDSVSARNPVVAAVKTPDGALLIDSRGIVYPLGGAPFLGSPATIAPSSPVVDVVWCGEPQRLRRNGRTGSKLGL